MKKAFLVVVFFLTLSIGYIVGTTSIGCSMETKNMEYKALKFQTNNPDELTHVLNTLSSQGWEYCGQETLNSGSLIFKK